MGEPDPRPSPPLAAGPGGACRLSSPAKVTPGSDRLPGAPARPLRQPRPPARSPFSSRSCRSGRRRASLAFGSGGRVGIRSLQCQREGVGQTLAGEACGGLGCKVVKREVSVNLDCHLWIRSPLEVILTHLTHLGWKAALGP
uniref:Uncharacterized protein n=1 Tax=Myotis myotis TaxID=51298 RepID=A0A7J7VIL4_MYOMY|nr:hypothetical protein mMyoMyo1_008389 [Myotis myotis]